MRGYNNRMRTELMKTVSCQHIIPLCLALGLYIIHYTLYWYTGTVCVRKYTLTYTLYPLLRAGLATYSSLRPLVYRESSVVLLCFQDQGRHGLPAWVREVRAVNVLRNTNLC